MPSIRRHARVPYSAEQMFDLVNDIEAYPDFLHWCRGAHVERSADGTVAAELDIGLSGFHRSFKTRNTPDRPRRIGIELMSGPFRRLQGQWEFAESREGGSEVHLSLDYEVGHSPLGLVLASVFEEVARSQMSAFVRRAKELYGPKK